MRFLFLQRDSLLSTIAGDRFSKMLYSHGSSWSPDVLGQEEESRLVGVVYDVCASLGKKQKLYGSCMKPFVSKNYHSIKFCSQNEFNQTIRSGNIFFDIGSNSLY